MTAASLAYQDDVATALSRHRRDLLLFQADEEEGRLAGGQQCRSGHVRRHFGVESGRHPPGGGDCSDVIRPPSTWRQRLLRRHPTYERRTSADRLCRSTRNEARC